MHPIERLRFVARAEGAGAGLLAQEAAEALAGFGFDPAGLVTACRRIVGRQPSCGPLWWLASCVLCADDPDAAAAHAARELAADPTPEVLAAELPDDATVVVLDDAEVVARGLARRGDVRALVLDTVGGAEHLARLLRRRGTDVERVDAPGDALAVLAAGMVVLEPRAAAETGLLASPGSLAAAAVARHVGRPVWAVLGVGRVLPDALVAEMARRVTADDRPWRVEAELLDWGLVDAVVAPGGRMAVAEAGGPEAVLARLRRDDPCPLAPELLRPLT